jgi:ParB-like chromosome segregation protein Spo0J
VNTYQLLPPLTHDEYESLKANIATRGVLQPVVVDEADAILDGHHRAQVCNELGIDYPRIVLGGLTELEKVEQALMLNLGRRHLTPEQRRDLVQRLHEDGHSVRWIAKATGISKSTVHRYVTPEAVPDGTPEPMTRAEAEEITETIRKGLAWLWAELEHWWAIDPALTSHVIVEGVLDDTMQMEPGEPRDWFVEWLQSLMPGLAA